MEIPVIEHSSETFSLPGHKSWKECKILRNQVPLLVAPRGIGQPGSEVPIEEVLTGALLESVPDFLFI